MKAKIFIFIMVISLCSCGNSEVYSLREQIEALESENSELRNRIAELESEKNEYESNIADLEDSNFSLQQSNSELESDLEDKENSIEDARYAVDNLRMQRIIDGDAYTSHGMMQDMDIDDIDNSLDY